jgi:hypothetical protein
MFEGEKEENLISKRAAAVEVIKVLQSVKLLSLCGIAASIIIGAVSLATENKALVFGAIVISCAWFVYNLAITDKELKRLKQKYQW